MTDTDAQSYIHRSPFDVLASDERGKREKYGAACEDRRAIFTPLCVSVDGMMGREATKFVHLANQLSHKWAIAHLSIGFEQDSRLPSSVQQFCVSEVLKQKGGQLICCMDPL